MSHAGRTAVAAEPYRGFRVRVKRVRRLSPSFLRVTFTGPDLDTLADNGYDQRVKLVLPLSGVGLDHFPLGGQWYARWRVLPDELRNPIRTCTVRAARPRAHEVDVDMVLHGDGGPASRWAGAVQLDDEVVIVGPCARYPGDHGGVAFRRHPRCRVVLLAGDETAVPAISSILECLPDDVQGEAILEVPDVADVLPLVHPPMLRVSWLSRDGNPHGHALVPAVRDAAACLLRSHPGTDPVDDADTDDGVLWEVPEDPDGSPGEIYAWLAGETGMIKKLRRHLVHELGFDRRNVAFMGYWRLGRSEGS